MKNTDNSQLRRLQTLGQAFNKDRVVSPEEMEAILEAIVGALATFKKETENINEDTKANVNNYFNIAEKEYEKVLSLFEDKHVKVSSEMNEKVSTIGRMIEEFKKIKPKDGVDGKDGISPKIEDIVPEVLKQIEIPEPKEPEIKVDEIVAEINRSTDENLKIDASKIKNLPAGRGITGRGIIEAPKDDKTYGRKNRAWVEVDDNRDHNHDDLYYTKSQVDTSLASKENISNKATTITGNENSDTKYPTTKAVQDKINETVESILNTPPSTLDTLNELAQALGDDPNFATTVANQIATKENTANKTTAITGNEASDTKFPTVKAIYDWATGLFATISSLNALTNTVNTNDSNAVHKTGNETASGDKTLTGNTTFGTNTEITTGKRVMVAGYSDTLPLQEWGDGTGTVGTYIRRTAGNVMAFIARNNGGYAHEFIGSWLFKNGLKVEDTIKADGVGVPLLTSNPNGLPVSQYKKEVSTNKKNVVEETWTQDVANSRGMRWDWYDDVDGSLTGFIRSKSLWGYTTDVNGNNLTNEQFLSINKKADNVKRVEVNAVLSADNYNVVSGQKNAGDYIELDGMRLTMSTSGNRSFGIMTASGTILIDGHSIATNHIAELKYKTFSLSVGTSFTYFESTWMLGGVGNVQETTFYNNTNGHFYKATGIVGPSYTPCRLRLERLD